MTDSISRQRGRPTETVVTWLRLRLRERIIMYAAMCVLYYVHISPPVATRQKIRGQNLSSDRYYEPHDRRPWYVKRYLSCFAYRQWGKARNFLRKDIKVLHSTQKLQLLIITTLWTSDPARTCPIPDSNGVPFRKKGSTVTSLPTCCMDFSDMCELVTLIFICHACSAINRTDSKKMWK
jgi:hypothetical protein